MLTINFNLDQMPGLNKQWSNYLQIERLFSRALKDHFAFWSTIASIPVLVTEYPKTHATYNYFWAFFEQVAILCVTAARCYMRSVCDKGGSILAFDDILFSSTWNDLWNFVLTRRWIVWHFDLWCYGDEPLARILWASTQFRLADNLHIIHPSGDFE